MYVHTGASPRSSLPVRSYAFLNFTCRSLEARRQLKFPVQCFVRCPVGGVSVLGRGTPSRCDGAASTPRFSVVGRKRSRRLERGQSRATIAVAARLGPRQLCVDSARVARLNGNRVMQSSTFQCAFTNKALGNGRLPGLLV